MWDMWEWSITSTSLRKNSALLCHLNSRDLSTLNVIWLQVNEYKTLIRSSGLEHKLLVKAYFRDHRIRPLVF